jgi:hypothetical protein
MRALLLLPAVLNELTKSGLANTCTLIERLKPTRRRQVLVHGTLNLCLGLRYQGRARRRYIMRVDGVCMVLVRRPL